MFASHIEFLSFVRVLYRPETYLEIGVEFGRSLFIEPAVGLLIGVDPLFEIRTPINTECRLALFRSSSDDFFGSRSYLRATSKAIDMTFVDGMHLAECVLRDIRNAETISHNQGIIIVHDICPGTEVQASRTQCPGDWMGDVYKVVPALAKFRPDLKIFNFSDIPPSGVMVIMGLDPSNRILFDRYTEIEAEMSALNYSDFQPKVIPELHSVRSPKFRELVTQIMEARSSAP